MKTEIKNEIQALEIALKDYKIHLKEIEKDIMTLQSYMETHHLHAGICFYIYENYNYKELYNFFKHTIKLKKNYLTKTPYELEFNRLKTIKSIKFRITWIEKYLKETKVKIS